MVAILLLPLIVAADIAGRCGRRGFSRRNVLQHPLLQFPLALFILFTSQNVAAQVAIEFG